MRIYIVAASMMTALAVQAQLTRADPNLQTELVAEQVPAEHTWGGVVEFTPSMPATVPMNECLPDPRAHGRRRWRDRHTGARYQVRGLLNRSKPLYLRQKRPCPG